MSIEDLFNHHLDYLLMIDVEVKLLKSNYPNMSPATTAISNVVTQAVLDLKTSIATVRLIPDTTPPNAQEEALLTDNANRLRATVGELQASLARFVQFK